MTLADELVDALKHLRNTIDDMEPSPIGPRLLILESKLIVITSKAEGKVLVKPWLWYPTTPARACIAGIDSQHSARCQTDGEAIANLQAALDEEANR